MKSLTRTFASTACFALAGAAFLGLQGTRQAIADAPEAKSAPATAKVGPYDHTAFGAVIKANYNRVPANGSELVRALKKLGDFAQMPIPFSAVNSSSGLSTPRVIIAPRPGGANAFPANEKELPDPKVKAPVGKQPANPLGGFGGFGGFPNFPGGIGGVGFGIPSREVAVPPLSLAKATDASLEGRLFLAANMEKTDDGDIRVKNIEIISWNSRKKRFDFGVIECGAQPELQILDGVRCFSCHKNKGPILSQGPWSNSTHNDVVRGVAMQMFLKPQNGNRPDPKAGPMDPANLNPNVSAVEPPGGWSTGLRSNPSLAALKEATTFDGISLVIPEPDACDSAIRQGGELARDRDVYRAMTKTVDGRRAFAILLAALASPNSVEQSNIQAKRDLDMAFTSNFPTFADEMVAITKATPNMLVDFSPSGSMGTIKSVTTSQSVGWGGGSSQRTDTFLVWGGDSRIVNEYSARRASGDTGMPSQKQPSNPRAFMRPVANVPAKPSTAVSAMGLGRVIGLTEGDRKFMSSALADLATKINNPKVTPATLAKAVFATAHFQDPIKARDIPDREEFKDLFAAALVDVAKLHKVAEPALKREDYASGPNVAQAGQEEKEIAIVPTTACLRCHDVKGIGKPTFNPIPMLAFDPFDKASRESWVRNNDAKKREQTLSRMLKRMVTDKDMPPEDAPEYEKFRAKDPAAFDALKDWLEAELKNAKGS